MTFDTGKWPAFTPRIFLVLMFSLGLVDPRAMVRSEGNMSLKVQGHHLNIISIYFSLSCSYTNVKRQIINACYTNTNKKPAKFKRNGREKLYTWPITSTGLLLSSPCAPYSKLAQLYTSWEPKYGSSAIHFSIVWSS
jgi:hypothetical protein